MQSELLTDKCRFEDGLREVIVPSQLVDDTGEVLCLPCGIRLELDAIEVGAGSIFECLVAEVLDEGACGGEVRVVDAVVEARSRIVSEEDSLRVGALPDAGEEIHQRVVTIILEAGGDDGDVHEAVGLHDDEPWRDGVAFRLTAEEVQVHAGLENIVEIVHVCILRLPGVVDRLLRVLSVLVDEDGDGLLVEGFHDASLVGRVLSQSFRRRFEVVGERVSEFGGNVGLEDTADEACHGRAVVSEDGLGIAVRELAVVAVASGLPQGVGLVVGYIEQSDDALQLGIEVAEAILRLFERFGTHKHQRLMQKLETQGHGQRGSADDGMEVIEKIGMHGLLIAGPFP